MANAWVGTSQGIPGTLAFGITGGQGTPLVIDTLSNKGYFYKSGTGVTELGATGLDIRSVAVNTDVLVTDSILYTTVDGVALTMPPAIAFNDGTVLTFYLGAAGTLDIVLPAGDNVYGS